MVSTCLTWRKAHSPRNLVTVELLPGVTCVTEEEPCGLGQHSSRVGSKMGYSKPSSMKRKDGCPEAGEEVSWTW